jgi:hypothetical protein
MTLFAAVELTEGRVTSTSRIAVRNAEGTLVAGGLVPERGQLGDGAPTRTAPHRIIAGLSALGVQPRGNLREAKIDAASSDRCLLLRVERLP